MRELSTVSYNLVSKNIQMNMNNDKKENKPKKFCFLTVVHCNLCTQMLRMLYMHIVVPKSMSNTMSYENVVKPR